MTPPLRRRIPWATRLLLLPLAALLLTAVPRGGDNAFTLMAGLLVAGVWLDVLLGGRAQPRPARVRVVARRRH